jgi:hypothetical protein
MCCEKLSLELKTLKNDMEEIKKLLKATTAPILTKSTENKYEFVENNTPPDNIEQTRTVSKSEKKRMARTKNQAHKLNILNKADQKPVIVSKAKENKFLNPLIDLNCSLSQSTLNSTASTLFLEHDSEELNQHHEHPCSDKKHPVSITETGTQELNHQQSGSNTTKYSPVRRPNTDINNTYGTNSDNKISVNPPNINYINNGNAYTKEYIVNEKNDIYSINQCLIIKGLPESDDNIPKKRLEHDLSQLQSCISPILEGNESLEICKAFRLGKYETSNFPRPLKIILREENQRDLLLQRRSLLKDGTSRIFFQREFTPKEREKYRELHTIMKSRMELGEKFLTIMNGEIVKRNPPYLWTTPVTISHQIGRI